MHPRGHELVHIRSMNWVQSTFITCHAFLFFARTSLDILGHMTVLSTTLHCSKLRKKLHNQGSDRSGAKRPELTLIVAASQHICRAPATGSCLV